MCQTLKKSFLCVRTAKNLLRPTVNKKDSHFCPYGDCKLNSIVRASVHHCDVFLCSCNVWKFHLSMQRFTHCFHFFPHPFCRKKKFNCRLLIQIRLLEMSLTKRMAQIPRWIFQTESCCLESDDLERPTKAWIQTSHEGVVRANTFWQNVMRIFHG